MTELSVGHFGIQFTFAQEAHDLMRYAQALASHEIAPGELAKLFEFALRAFVREREKRKFAACVRAPRMAKKGAKPSANPRCVPAPVRREVWMRDGGRCTFVSASGRRCEACDRLEFDHVILRAQGGESTTPNLRLRCRAHNQLGAEQALGAERVRGARENSRRRATEARLAKARERERAARRIADGRKEPGPADAAARPHELEPAGRSELVSAATCDAPRAREARRPAEPSPARAAVAAVARAIDEARAAERARPSPTGVRPGFSA